MEAVASMEMTSGGTFASWRRAGTEILSPELEFRDGGGAPGVFLEFRQSVSRF